MMGEITPRRALTQRELDIMRVLWDRGAATVSDVREHLPVALAYTTVLTILRTLEAKGHVGHESAGRAYLYFPLTVRRDAARAALQHVLQSAFQGSVSLLMNRLIADQTLSIDQLRNLREQIDRRLGAPPASGSV
jgi:predicted transcriptional regulator